MNRQRRKHQMPWAFTTLALALSAGALSVSVLSASVAYAQETTGPKKLYCWDDGSRRVCSDALPPSAVGKQRTEFDQRTGTAVNRVARELTDEERAKIASEEAAKQNQEEQRRRELAMVMNYETEQDLRRSFDDRILLIDESLKGATLAQTNLQRNLITLLRQANEMELQSKPVNKKLRDKIHAQHAELQGLRALQLRQQAERIAINNEFEQALTRYRTLKSEAAATAAGPTSATTPAPAPTGG